MAWAVPRAPWPGAGAAAIGFRRGIAAAHGLASLVAPVRPTEKHRYPLSAMEGYAEWRRADGGRFEPWRGAAVEVRWGGVAGALCVSCPRSAGGLARWGSGGGAVGRRSRYTGPSMDVFQSAQMLIAVSVGTSILLQARGTGLSGTFGGESTAYRSRRGIERTLFRLTILLVIVFVLISIVGARTTTPS